MDETIAKCQTKRATNNLGYHLFPKAKDSGVPEKPYQLLILFTVFSQGLTFSQQLQINVCFFSTSLYKYDKTSIPYSNTCTLYAKTKHYSQKCHFSHFLPKWMLFQGPKRGQKICRFHFCSGNSTIIIILLLPYLIKWWINNAGPWHGILSELN
jgi:hypothetical protein